MRHRHIPDGTVDYGNELEFIYRCDANFMDRMIIEDDKDLFTLQMFQLELYLTKEKMLKFLDSMKSMSGNVSYMF